MPQVNSDPAKNFVYCKQEKKPVRRILSAIGTIVVVYSGFYGLSMQNYQVISFQAELRANGLLSQLSTENREELKRLLGGIPSIQEIKCPRKPNILNPISVFFSLFGKMERNKDTVATLKDAVVNWKRKLGTQELIISSKHEIPTAGDSLPLTITRHYSGLDWEEWDREKEGYPTPIEQERSISPTPVNLEKIELNGANMNNANLRGAQMKGSSWIGANLSESNLQQINWTSSNLAFADLSDSDLIEANLSNCNLTYANLRSADLSWVDLTGIKLEYFDPQTKRKFSGLRNWKAVLAMKNANVHGLDKVDEEFYLHARSHGAVDMQADAWQRHKAAHGKGSK